MVKLKKLKNSVRFIVIMFFCLSLLGIENQTQSDKCVLVSEYYFINGEYEKCLKISEKCKDNKKKYAIIAMTYYKKNKFEEFKKNYNKYLKYRKSKNENDSYALTLLIMRGNYCMSSGNLSCALKSFESVKMLAPYFAEAYYNIAIIMLKTSGLRKAENCADITFHFQKAFEIDNKLNPTKDYYSFCGLKNKALFVNKKK